MSLVLTLMQSLRAKYQPNTLDKNELRRSQYGAWDFYKSQSNLSTGVLTGDMKSKIKSSFGNTVTVPVLDSDTVTISNVRACTVADSENTSKLVTLTFVTYAFGFTMTPAQHYNNDIAYQADWDRKMEKYLLKFASTLDTAAVNNLSANKNTYFPAAMTDYYPVVGNALQVTQAQKNDFYNNLEAIRRTQDYYGKIHIISSTSGLPMVNRLEAQGANNGINERFQLAGYEWHTTNRLTNGAGVQSTNYSVPEGMVAVENRNDPDAIVKSKTGKGQIWDEINMPIVDLKMASYFYDDCADRSALHAATAGLTRTKVEGYEFSTDICFINSYNSAPSTNYGPILKAEISAT